MKARIFTHYHWKLTGTVLVLITYIMFGVSSGFAQKGVSINDDGSAPNASAMLDVVSTDKGILMPRVALTNTGSASPVTSPATSLMVYNTATAGDVTPGYYWWDGSQWVRFGDGTGGGGCEWTDVGSFLHPTDDASQLTRVYETASPVYRLFAKSRSFGDFAEGYLGYYGNDFEATNRHIGVYGEAGTGINNWGVVGIYGVNDYGFLGGNGKGVYGKSSTIAVYGQCSGDKAIYGESTHNSGAGIYGYSTGALGYGVFGKSTNFAGYFEGHGCFTGTTGDVNVYLKADSDNSGENDNPRLEFQQDGNAVNGGLGFVGDAGQIYTGSLGNAMYMESNYASGALQLATNSTARMTIEPAGDVGIGTTNPTEALHVVGNIRMVDGNEAVDYVLISDANGVGSWESLAANTYGTNNQGVTGTTNATVNTTVWTDVPQMTITFTPVHNTVYVYYTGSGYESVGAMPMQYVDHRILKDGALIAGSNTTCGDYDDTRGVVSSWNAALLLAVSVTAGVSTTIKVQWRRDGLVTSAIICNSATEGEYCHRSLTIID